MPANDIRMPPMIKASPIAPIEINVEVNPILCLAKRIIRSLSDGFMLSVVDNLLMINSY
jgi:hypothetical protein